MATDYEEGVLVGLLVGEGHFGGDGRQPQVTLRMHVRHEAIFRWIERTFPGGKLYGPYHHDGRHYYQWMARGPFLREELLPILGSRLSADLDAHAYGRLQEMRARYQRILGTAVVGDGIGGTDTDSDPPTVEGPGNRAERAVSAFQQLHGPDAS